MFPRRTATGSSQKVTCLNIICSICTRFCAQLYMYRGPLIMPSSNHAMYAVEMISKSHICSIWQVDIFGYSIGDCRLIETIFQAACCKKAE